MPALPVTVNTSIKEGNVPKPRVNFSPQAEPIDITLGSPEDALAGSNQPFIDPDATEPEGKQPESVTRVRPLIPTQGNSDSEVLSAAPVLPPVAVTVDTWKPTVLVVDDSSMNRKMLVRMLISKGFACREAEDGVQALSEMSSMNRKRLGHNVHSTQLMGANSSNNERRKSHRFAHNAAITTERRSIRVAHTATSAKGWSVILPSSSSSSSLSSLLLSSSSSSSSSSSRLSPHIYIYSASSTHTMSFSSQDLRSIY